MWTSRATSSIIIIHFAHMVKHHIKGEKVPLIHETPNTKMRCSEPTQVRHTGFSNTFTYHRYCISAVNKSGPYKCGPKVWIYPRVWPESAPWTRSRIGPPTTSMPTDVSLGSNDPQATVAALTCHSIFLEPLLLLHAVFVASFSPSVALFFFIICLRIFSD